MSEIRTFRASSLEAAMLLVHRDLGEEAVILQSRELTRKRLLPWKQPKVEVEITAGLGTRWERAAIDFSDTAGLDLESLESEHLSAEMHGEKHEELSKSSESSPQLSALEERLNSIQSMLEQMGEQQIVGSSRDVPVELFELYAELIDIDLEENLARDLVFRLKQQFGDCLEEDTQRAQTLLTGMVENELNCRGPIEVTPQKRKVVALVGPTGVGKTTTIAKLAANFRLRDEIRMGLVTVDTYRIAAVEQLRTYAEIIDLPMKIVTSPEEMTQAMDELSEMDLVLIDTAGRSPKDDLKVQELKQLLKAADVDEVHLVLSLSAGLRSLQTTIRSFATADVSSLILTKLDESDSLGTVLSLHQEINLPISYLTTGQNVPDDIEPACNDRLARLILGRDSLH
ncbi:MAG: flagellar biosynthesis protein FlhF [Planctomycetaceae bacterium]|nr:flagellar biosynthesis protein FlhF [Planctomycetaceae bacterium]